MSLTLNYMQERELSRLLDYERRYCSRNGRLVNHCAFPSRPSDNLQRELIAQGALAMKVDGARGSIVVITSEGYSYFPELARSARRAAEERRHERNLVIITAIFCALCMVIGFLIGFIVH